MPCTPLKSHRTIGDEARILKKQAACALIWEAVHKAVDFALGRWWEKDNEIDIVATDHDRRNCLVGECKFRNDKVGLKVFRSLQAKSIYLPVAEDAVFHYWLFSRNGFDDALIELSERDPYLHLVSMDELLD